MRSKCTSARWTRVYSRVMIIDFQHHFLPLELAARHGFKPGERGNLLEGGVPKLTVHQKLYDIDAQIQDMNVAGIDLAVLSWRVYSVSNGGDSPSGPSRKRSPTDRTAQSLRLGFW